VFAVQEYLDRDGHSPFALWFSALKDATARARISTAIFRMEDGNFGDSKSVGEGVFERRIDYGPGYRIYFGRDGDALVILLGGGTKKKQAKDIENARAGWDDYKARRRKALGDSNAPDS
jgi:putative addiction module killer protein